MASSPFSYGMPNFTLQFSNSIPTVGSNARIGLGGNTPLYTPFSFDRSQIPQMTHYMGGMASFNPRSNPPTSGWNSQPGRQVSTQVPSNYPTSSADSNKYTWHDESSSILQFPTWGRSVSHFGQPPTWI
jgi:hypothetical protein